jgi:hypothetical protein
MLYEFDDAFVDDADPDDQDQDILDPPREDLDLAVAVRMLVVRRFERFPDAEERDDRGDQVIGGMQRFGHDAHQPGHEPDDDLEDNEGRVGKDGEEDDPALFPVPPRFFLDDVVVNRFHFDKKTHGISFLRSHRFVPAASFSEARPHPATAESPAPYI